MNKGSVYDVTEVKSVPDKSLELRIKGVAFIVNTIMPHRQEVGKKRMKKQFGVPSQVKFHMSRVFECITNVSLCLL